MLTEICWAREGGREREGERESGGGIWLVKGGEDNRRAFERGMMTENVEELERGEDRWMGASSLSACLTVWR